MEEFESRYEVTKPWTRIRTGRLVQAYDRKLKRSVLLVRIVENNRLRVREALSKLSTASRFSDRSFLPLLDGYAGEDGLYVVLSDDGGKPLNQVLDKLNWSGEEILQQIKGLAGGLRAARKERMLHYAQHADNLWLDRDGRLRIIDYWTEGQNEDRDVRGLAQLLYQLSACTPEPAPSMTAYNEVLRDKMSHLPGGSGEDVVQWAVAAFHPSCTLREFELGLDKLLTPRDSGPVLEETEEPHEPSLWSWKHRFGRWIWICGGVVAVWAIFIWFVTHPGQVRKLTGEEIRPSPTQTVPAVGATPGEEAAETPEPAASAAPATETTRKPAQGNGGTGTGGGGNTPAPTEAPAATTAPASSPSPTVVPGQGETGGAVGADGTVPNLVGLTREEAERSALAAGLKYQFFMEANTAQAGTVFRQDLEAGQAVAEGEKITFWVSRGE